MFVKWMKILGMALIGCILVKPIISQAAGNSEEHVFEAEEDMIAYIDVAVATLWTEPNILREVDQPSASNPVAIWKWKEDMTYEQELQLSGDGMLETQALYGNKVTILETEGEWVKVAVDGQPTPKEELGYSGWMPASQLTYTTKFANKTDDPFVMVDAPTSYLYHTPAFRHQGMEISYNTRLPYLGESKHAYRVMLPSGSHAWVKKADAKTYESQKAIPTPTGQALVEAGKQFLGLHYLWAGMSGFGFDCSGFTFTLYQSHGITIPRDSSIQATHGEPVAYEDIQPGDLLFFAHDQGKGSVHHVAMYAGDGKMIHSPNSKKDVEIIPVTTKGYYEKLSGIRRYLSKTD
ncbi:C40 family peptidase [Virgibacillus sp. AGTR]|nr:MULTISPECIES: C40 family peptidase [unclassified Virgibacillus]MCC2248573.1 C40 family peptidase [Virgibacillus sp. AGTR]MDY7043225.1 C40 family peptidase [Virgibacillus sp. M23]